MHRRSKPLICWVSHLTVVDQFSISIPACFVHRNGWKIRFGLRTPQTALTSTAVSIRDRAPSQPTTPGGWPQGPPGVPAAPAPARNHPRR